MKAYLFVDSSNTCVPIENKLSVNLIKEGKLIVLVDGNEEVVLVGNNYRCHSELLCDYMQKMHGVDVPRWPNNYEQEKELFELLNRAGVKPGGGMDISFSTVGGVFSTRIMGYSSLLGGVEKIMLNRAVQFVFEDSEEVLSWMNLDRFK